MPTPICPDDCSAVLPQTDFSDCAPVILLSEIEKIYVGKGDTNPFADWTTANEWTTRLSQTSTEADVIRPLTVIADKPAAAPVNKDISNGRTIVIGKDHTLNVTIDDVSDANYEFMRSVECGTATYRIWYQTKGGMLYGGNAGIEAKLLLNNVLARGKDSIDEIAGTITWREKFHPERVISPIA